MAPCPPLDPNTPNTNADQGGLPLAQVAQIQINNYVAHKQRQLSAMVKDEETKTELELQRHIKACLDAINYLGPSTEVGKDFKTGILAHFPGDDELGHLAYRKVMQGIKGRSPHWDKVGSKLRQIVEILDKGHDGNGSKAQQGHQCDKSTQSTGELLTPKSPHFSAPRESSSSTRKRRPSRILTDLLFPEDDQDCGSIVASDSQSSKRPRTETATDPAKAPVANMSQLSGSPAAASQKDRPTNLPQSPPQSATTIECQRPQRNSDANTNATSASPSCAAATTQDSPKQRGDKMSMKRTANIPKNKLPGKPLIRVPPKQTQEKPHDEWPSG